MNNFLLFRYTYIHFTQHALIKIIKSITINNRNYFNPATFIEVLVPNEELVGMYMCVLVISILLLSMIFIWIIELFWQLIVLYGLLNSSDNWYFQMDYWTLLTVGIFIWIIELFWQLVVLYGLLNFSDSWYFSCFILLQYAKKNL
jgi:hypothetical protein